LINYFEASIRQHIRRGEHLIGSIPKPTQLPHEFHPLLQTCNNELVQALEELEALQEPQMLLPEYQPERLRRFRRAVQQISLLESTCVAALARHHPDDEFLTRLVALISGEISYPLLSPIVTSLSQHYYHIYPFLNLLFVPLGEGAFLLHLPDLYHELAHPLLTARARYNPHVKPFQGALLQSLELVFDYVLREQQTEKRGRGPRAVGAYLQLWEKSWIDWAVEFFCDLFAIYTLGPAFAWAHIHLCAEGNEHPFRVPLDSPSSHPANHARMQAMLYGLQLVDFMSEAETIKQHWEQLLEMSGAKAEAEYRQCFPEQLLENIAQKAYEGIYSSGFRIVSPHTNQPVHVILNEAWNVFWSKPKNYPIWEQKAVSDLRKLTERQFVV
jgi:hypothetical protein